MSNKLSNYIDAFNKGQELAKNFALNETETTKAIDDFKEQVGKIIDKQNIKIDLIGTSLRVIDTDYQTVEATIAKLEMYSGETTGIHAIRLSYDDRIHICEDTEALENAFRELLKNLSVARILHRYINSK